MFFYDLDYFGVIQLSLWLQSLSLCLDDSGNDPESRAKCILAYLSMTVPRSWWDRALKENTIAENLARLLYDLRNELVKVPGLDQNFEFALLIALAYADDDTIEAKHSFGNVDSQYSIEDYLNKAKKN